MNRFNTCGCEKQFQRCAITGFHFKHMHMNGMIMNGDLFVCKVHKTLGIFGIPQGSVDLETNNEMHGYLVYPGYANEQQYMRTSNDGFIRLDDETVTRLEKYYPEIRSYIDDTEQAD